MIIFGITGGSGTGKTTVSAIFSQLGVQVIDTDVIAHNIVEKGSECLKELTGYFGEEILLSDGTLDRKKLAHIAFSNDEKKAALNRITHKYIKAQVEADIKNSSAHIIAIDGAVIIGSSIEPLCGFIVSVISDRETRIERIKERDALTDEQATQRLAAQRDDDFYIQHSEYIIYNNGGTEDLRRQVCMLYDEIKRL